MPGSTRRQGQLDPTSARIGACTFALASERCRQASPRGPPPMQRMESSVVSEGSGEPSLWRSVVEHRRRIVKSLLGLALLGVAAWMFRRNVVLIVSTEAVVMSDLVSVSAPIDGFLTYQDVDIGVAFSANRQLAKIENPLVDEAPVAALRAQRDSLQAEVATLRDGIAQMESMGTKLDARGRAYQVQRGVQLELQISQTEARLEAERARLVASKSQAERSQTLALDGLTSDQSLEEARRDEQIAVRTLEATQREIDGLRAAATGLRQGFNLADFSGMDRSYSSQRSDDVRLRVTDWHRQLAERTARLPVVEAELTTLQQQVERLQSASVALPQRGRIWSIESGDAVFVTRGTSLLKVLDCSRIRALAYVSERNYDRIAVGQSATVRLSGSKRAYPARVELRLGSPDARLSAAAAASVPIELRDRFAVMVGSTALKRDLSEACETGQNAEVVFEPAGHDGSAER